MMKRIMSYLTNNRLLVSAVFLFLWAVTLVQDQNYMGPYMSPYLLCLLLGFFCLTDNEKQGTLAPAAGKWLIRLTSGLFAAAVLTANYNIFFRDSISLVNALCNGIGGYLLCYHILVFCCRRYPRQISRQRKTGEAWIFLGSFLILVLIRMVYLFGSAFPGHLSNDSFSQITQSVNGGMTNHHPVWHTVFIDLCLTLGTQCGLPLNDAVAVYSVAQLLFLSACMAYTVTTLYQAGIPEKWVAAIFALYAFCPYHIAYSVSMWKDVVFGGAVLVLVTALYRVLYGIGKSKVCNYGICALSGVGMCLWRTNGWLAFVLASVLAVLTLRRQYPKLVLLLLAVAVGTWILRGPVLDGLEIRQPDLVESLSIPVQQVARVIAGGCPLTEEEAELLNRIVDVDRVPELYDWHLSDYIKDEIRRKNNAYFEENPELYLKLWIQLGLKYPGEYGKAWVDQTKGYWNGGYDYWVYSRRVDENPFGLFATGGIPVIDTLFDWIFWMFEQVALFRPLVCIGLQVWATAAVCVVTMVQRRKEWFLTIPVLGIVGTLLVATPVFSEFRYVYSLILICPLLILLMVWRTDTALEKET